MLLWSGNCTSVSQKKKKKKQSHLIIELLRKIALLKLNNLCDRMEVFAAKNILRQQIKRALKELSASDRRNQSTEVTKKVLNHPKYIASKGVSVFISLKDEVDTSDIIKDIFSSGKKCFIPRYNS